MARWRGKHIYRGAYKQMITDLIRSIDSDPLDWRSEKREMEYCTIRKLIHDSDPYIVVAISKGVLGGTSGYLMIDGDSTSSLGWIERFRLTLAFRRHRNFMRKQKKRALTAKFFSNCTFERPL
jgi:hypothetical protein